jgi:hypothetical protein
MIRAMHDYFLPAAGCQQTFSRFRFEHHGSSQTFLARHENSFETFIPKISIIIMSQATTVDETFSRWIYFVVHKIDVRYGCIMNCVSSLTAQALLRPRTECNFGNYEVSAERPPVAAATVPRGRGSRGSGSGCPAASAAGWLLKYFFSPQKYTFSPQPIFYPLFLNEGSRIRGNHHSKQHYRFQR